MNEFRIYYNFKRALKKADELTEIAQNMRKSANGELSNEIESIKCSWQGDGASIYINQANKLKDEIIDSANRLENAAQIIRQVAKRTYNTEKRALEIAKKRTYRNGAW